MAVHSTILEWLEKELFEGRLQLGQDLPDDKEIAEAVGATHSSTREALKHLEDMGVVRLYEGRKKTIITQLVEEPAASAGSALRLHMANAKYPVRDMVQTRLVVEGWALQHADPQHPAMEELTSLQDQMSRENISLKEFHDLEVSFHIALVKIGGNELLTGLMTALREPLFEYMMSLVGRNGLWSTVAVRTRAQHKAIVDAIASGDNALASMLVTAHIREQYEEAGLDLDAPRIPDTEHEPALEIAPVEDEDEDLIPENPDFEPSADLLNALQSIEPSVPTGSAYRGVSASSARQAPSQDGTENVTGAQQELAIPSARLTHDSREAYAKVEGRRQRRGTVSVPVHATVIKPVDRSTPTGVISGQVRPRHEDARLDDTVTAVATTPGIHTPEGDTVRATPRPIHEAENTQSAVEESTEEPNAQHHGLTSSLREKARFNWRRKSRNEQADYDSAIAADLEDAPADVEQATTEQPTSPKADATTDVPARADDTSTQIQELPDNDHEPVQQTSSHEEPVTHAPGRIKQFFGWGSHSSKRTKEPEWVALENTGPSSMEPAVDEDNSNEYKGLEEADPAPGIEHTESEPTEAEIVSHELAGEAQEHSVATAIEDAEQARMLTADEVESDTANPLAGATNVVVKHKSKKKKRKRR